MDKTPEYIKMCEKAGEIQAQSDWPAWYEAVFTPRQDQLQAMVEGHWTEVLGKFTYWLDGPSPLVSIPTKKLLKERVDFVKRLEQINSMEQLWLAFVMKEKYGKVWNGEEWVLVHSTCSDPQESK